MPRRTKMSCVPFFLLLYPAIGLSQISDPAEVQRLIKQLGDEQFAEREKATNQLLDIGRRVIPDLEKAAQSNQPEVSSRALSILAIYLDSPDEQTFDDSFQAIRRLSNSVNANIAGRATRQLWPSKDWTDWIAQLGGEYDVNDDGQIISLRLNRNKTVAFGNQPIALLDDQLENLRRLRWLKSLTLQNRTRITDAGLAQLTTLRNLEVLNLSSTRINGESLRALSGLKKLVGLGIPQEKLTVNQR